MDDPVRSTSFPTSTSTSWNHACPGSRPTRISLRTAITIQTCRSISRMNERCDGFHYGILCLDRIVSGKIAVVGHTPQPEILNLGHLICLDTGCAYGGKADGDGDGERRGVAGGDDEYVQWNVVTQGQRSVTDPFQSTT